jgi:Holliday junction resolvase RusA-like endonuclease
MRFSSEAEFKRWSNRRSTRDPRAICKDNATSKVPFEAMEAVQRVQSISAGLYGTHSVGLTILISNQTRADADNVFKGIADALQGLAFENDKQIKKGSFEICDY